MTFNSSGQRVADKQKSALALLTCLWVGLASTLSLTPDAVAKQMDPVITLSQVQPLMPAAPMALVRPKAVITGQKRSLPAARAKGKIPPQDHFRLGLALKAKGDTNRALIEFLKATQKNPRQINAFYEQALIFRKQGYLKLADSALEQALRIAGAQARSKQRKAKALFNASDLNRIRLLLATVRLEQGNVGSAAEELARSLGIALPAPAAAPAETANKSSEEASSPTTILQSLHPVVEISGSEKQTSTETPPESGAEGRSPATAAADSTEKEDAAGQTVTELIKEGLAGLKEHVFNPLSILGLPRIALDTEKSSPGKKKEKRAKKRSRRESKPKAEEKRKRRTWLEKKLPLTPQSDINLSADAVKVQEPKNSGAKAETPQAAETEIAGTESKEAPLAEILEKETVDHTGDAQPNAQCVTDAATPIEPDTFSLTMPPSITQKISLVAALLSAFSHESTRPSLAAQPPEKQLDPVEERLKYLAEHGTSSLKEGEAFMFSEESGEATLFTAGGEVIRRTIASARGHEEVAQLRRPDILIPEELIYNLALMAKILPKQDEPKETVGEAGETAPTLKMPAIIARPHGFSDWLRGVLNL